MAVDMDQQRLDETQIPEGAIDPGEDPGKFSVAFEVQAVANRLITDVQRFGHLAQARILYLWRNGGWKTKGRHVMGKAYVLNEEQRFLIGRDLKVIINSEAWEKASEHQREALIAHELMHFEPIDDDKDGNPRWRNALHDLEEFNFIVRKYGLWDESLRMFMDAHEKGQIERRQARMFDEDGDDERNDTEGMNIVQKQWGVQPTEEEPQASEEETDGDPPASEDATESQEAGSPEAPNPSILSEHDINLLDEPYEGTDLRVYACRGNWDKEQLREAAYQGGLPECVIRLTREVPRGDDVIEQVNHYHWNGDREIQRITRAMRKGFVQEHAAAS